MLECELSGDFSAVRLKWMNSHSARKICHSGRWKLNKELHSWVLDTLYYDGNILRCFISVRGTLRDFQLSLSFRHSVLWLKHPALFHLSTRDIAWLPRSSPSSRSKSSSKPFYFLSAIKFLLWKLTRWSSWSRLFFLLRVFLLMTRSPNQNSSEKILVFLLSFFVKFLLKILIRDEKWSNCRAYFYRNITAD